MKKYVEERMEEVKVEKGRTSAKEEKLRLLQHVQQSEQ